MYIAHDYDAEHLKYTKKKLLSPPTIYEITYALLCFYRFCLIPPEMTDSE